VYWGKEGKGVFLVTFCSSARELIQAAALPMPKRVSLMEMTFAPRKVENGKHWGSRWGKEYI
jgi:hypothetical protein